MQKSNNFLDTTAIGSNQSKSQTLETLQKQDKLQQWKKLWNMQIKEIIHSSKCHVRINMACCPISDMCDVVSVVHINSLHFLSKELQGIFCNVT